MQPITNLLLSAARKAAKLLQRDYFELETLQNSKRGTNDFVKQSYLRTKSILTEELQKAKTSILFPDDQLQLSVKENALILINPIDSLSNLSRGIPLFGTTITYMRRINQLFVPFSSLVHFPVIGDTYYAEKGGGVWLDKAMYSASKISRLRVSSCNILETAIISGDDSAFKEIVDIRGFGSICYDVSLLVTGKIDAVYYSQELDKAHKYMFELMMQESGGLVLSDIKGQFVASNYDLAEKIKQHLAKNS